MIISSQGGRETNKQPSPTRKGSISRSQEKSEGRLKCRTLYGVAKKPVENRESLIGEKKNQSLSEVRLDLTQRRGLEELPEKE